MTVRVPANAEETKVKHTSFTYTYEVVDDIPTQEHWEEEKSEEDKSKKDEMAEDMIEEDMSEVDMIEEDMIEEDKNKQEKTEITTFDNH
jgi:hypothetical protein